MGASIQIAGFRERKKREAKLTTFYIDSVERSTQIIIAQSIITKQIHRRNTKSSNENINFSFARFLYSLFGCGYNPINNVYVCTLSFTFGNYVSQSLQVLLLESLQSIRVDYTDLYYLMKHQEKQTTHLLKCLLSYIFCSLCFLSLCASSTQVFIFVPVLFP